MISFLKKKTFPIGVYPDSDAIKMAQFALDGSRLCLSACGIEPMPEDVEQGSKQWQSWAIGAIKKLRSEGGFKGSHAIVALPANEVVIDHVKLAVIDGQANEAAVQAKIRQKLPFDGDDALIKYVTNSGTDALVIATDKNRVNRFLAVCQRVGLNVDSMTVWPIAMANSYTTFFARRESDAQETVMLTETSYDFTGVVICKYDEILFARLIPVGFKHITNEGSAAKLISELVACRQHFESLCQTMPLSRLVFLSSESTLSQVYYDIAQEMKIPAQIGNVLQAVDTTKLNSVDKRDSKIAWATAFGLSLCQN